MVIAYVCSLLFLFISVSVSLSTVHRAFVFRCTFFSSFVFFLFPLFFSVGSHRDAAGSVESDSCLCFSSLLLDIESAAWLPTRTPLFRDTYPPHHPSENPRVPYGAFWRTANARCGLLRYEHSRKALLVALGRLISPVHAVRTYIVRRRGQGCEDEGTERETNREIQTRQGTSKRSMAESVLGEMTPVQQVVDQMRLTIREQRNIELAVGYGNMLALKALVDGKRFVSCNAPSVTKRAAFRLHAVPAMRQEKLLTAQKERNTAQSKVTAPAWASFLRTMQVIHACEIVTRRVRAGCFQADLV